MPCISATKDQDGPPGLGEEGALKVHHFPLMGKNSVTPGLLTTSFHRLKRYTTNCSTDRELCKTIPV